MLKYDTGTGSKTNWIVEETQFTPELQGKCETIFNLGNGYLGLRSATEESYVGQVRNFFVAGTFNKFAPDEVTELPNAADCIGMDIRIDGRLFNLNKGRTDNYSRKLDLQTGEMTRSFQWTDQFGRSFEFKFRRFVSLDDRHLIASTFSIKSLTHEVTIEIKSGINGQVSNSGAQHFHEGTKRIYDSRFVQMVQTTGESQIVFLHNTVHDVEGDAEVQSRFEMDRRKVSMVYTCTLNPSQSVSGSKINNVFTSRDNDHEARTVEELQTHSLEHIKGQSSRGYEALLKASAEAWSKKWERIDIKIEGKNPFDQLAIRFAQYHLIVMTPAHDNRMGIGAKGLSGEGYKGHSFWDTEIFMFPFYAFTMPEVARSLLEYRYNTIEGARKKALENGYRGAMYPWESAWAADGEVTPVWGAADIITGKPTKIWSGFIEQHITSDVAFATWQYYMITGDEDFMNRCGYEILIDTGIFWSSRLEWNEEKERYHINDVVGPDEYKEHVNNDAFTNYTAHWCMRNAIEYCSLLEKEQPELYKTLGDKLNLAKELPILKERVELIYLPEAREDGVIPQDDTYLTLRDIDLSKYKTQDHVGSIFRDYNLDQINEIQVSKQASIVMLMYLLEHLFDDKVKSANYNYYEPRTLHDSSLSLSTHAVLAADLGKPELAYSLFRRASEIDLGPNMRTSDHGIHAASLGGIWQILVCGFGGVRMVGGELRIAPNLPKEISRITFPLTWRGEVIRVTVDRDSPQPTVERTHPSPLLKERE